MKDEMLTEGMAFSVSKIIKQFVKSSPYNVFEGIEGHYFEEPIVQFASADNPLFESYKEIIGPYHLTPKELLDRAFPKRTESYGTVISIVLPISAQTRMSNRKEQIHGSKEWALTRYYGDELFVDKLVEHTIDYLKSLGYWGVAPSRETYFYKKQIGQDISSNWSERHIAFAAGLGTFSINDGFITEKGIAVKLISIVTDAHMPQSEQRNLYYQQNCLWNSKGTCGACMKRCPVGAITEAGHDKFKCYKHCYGEASREVAQNYGGSSAHGSGCGLCQTAVPCEFRNPVGAIMT